MTGGSLVIEFEKLMENLVLIERMCQSIRGENCTSKSFLGHIEPHWVLVVGVCEGVVLQFFRVNAGWV